MVTFPLFCHPHSRHLLQEEEKKQKHNKALSRLLKGVTSSGAVSWKSAPFNLSEAAHQRCMINK